MIDERTKTSLAERAGLRCECHNPGCRHHLKGRRCPRGLRAGRWVVVTREPKAGDRLWNLLAMCPECAATYGKKGA